MSFKKKLMQKEYLERDVMGRNIEAIALLKRFKWGNLIQREAMRDVKPHTFQAAIKKIKELIVKGRTENTDDIQLINDQLNIIFSSPLITAQTPTTMDALYRATLAVNYPTDWGQIPELRRVYDENINRTTVDRLWYFKPNEVQQHIAKLALYCVRTSLLRNDPVNVRGSTSAYKPIWISSGGSPIPSGLSMLYEMGIATQVRENNFYPDVKLILDNRFDLLADSRIVRAPTPEDERLTALSDQLQRFNTIQVPRETFTNAMIIFRTIWTTLAIQPGQRRGRAMQWLNENTELDMLTKNRLINIYGAQPGVIGPIAQQYIDILQA
jgi:hypothetical protein